MHLPVWMGCLLLHRVPNTAANREEQKLGKVIERVERGFARGYPAPEFPESGGGRPPLPLPGPFLLPPVMPGLGGDRVSWGGLSGVGGGARRRRRGELECPSKAACDDEGGTEEEKEFEGRATIAAASSGKRWWQVWR